MGWPSPAPPGTDRESGILLRDGALIDLQPPMGACQLEAPTTSKTNL